MSSLWKDVVEIKETYPSLEKDLEVDVVIIGGGITGITAAKQLIEAGKKVAVIDTFAIGGVTTGSSTGNLYTPTQPLYQSIEKKFTHQFAQNVAYSRQAAIDFIESTINAYELSCQFKRRPWYAYSNQSENVSLFKEFEFFEKMDMGATVTKDLPLNVTFKKAFTLPNQARFNPLEYVRGLASRLHRKGCFLFEYTQALKITDGDDCIVNTKFADITAKQVIIATHTPLGINPIQFYSAPYRSYVLAVKLKNSDYPEGHYWNMDEPRYALCSHPILNAYPEVLMIAGSHHKTGQGSDMKDHFKKLTTFLEKQFDIAEITARWSAQHYHTADNIPYIGRALSSSKNTYIATGYFADGLVYGTLAGIILGDLLAGNDNNFFHLYDSNRKNLLKSSSFLIREGMNIFLQYLKDLPIFTNHRYTHLKIGEGRIVQMNQKKYAISRDKNNQLHIVSAVCPHMKGIVAWNNAEETWDCPLHGSRFTCSGDIIEGPTLCPLKKSHSFKGDL